MGPKYGALAIGEGQAPENLLLPDSISSSADDARNALRRAANARYVEQRRPQVNEAHEYVFQTARSLMHQRELFKDPDPRDVARYGETPLGRDMLLGRRMLEAGVTFVKVNSYGWDTHGDNFNRLQKNLLPPMDKAASALLVDLKQRGMLDDVLVLMMGEM